MGLSEEVVVRRRAVKKVCEEVDAARDSCARDDFAQAKESLKIARDSLLWIRNQAKTTPSVLRDEGPDGSAIEEMANEFEEATQSLVVEVDRREATCEAEAALAQGMEKLATSETCTDAGERETLYASAMQELEGALNRFEAAANEHRVVEVKKLRAHAQGKRLLEEARSFHHAGDFASTMEKAEEACKRLEEASATDLLD